MKKIEDFQKAFAQNLSNDLNVSGALAVVWGVAKSNLPNTDKLDLVLDFDQVLGLKLAESAENIQDEKIPEKVTELISKREEYRKAGDYKKADEVRISIKKRGYEIKDTKDGIKVTAR